VKITIVGMGTIGSKLAIYLLSKGIEVCCITTRMPDEVKERLWSMFIKRNPETTVDKSMIQISNSYSIAIGSDLIIDASAESYEVKESVYSSINQNVSGSTVIATTTSSLSIEKLSLVARPSVLMGLHFFNPPDKMKLVEVTYSKENKRIVDSLLDVLQQLLVDKQFIVMPMVQGYICNRILFVYLNASFNYHLATDISFSDIDTAMELGTNVPMGPFKLSDYIGNDITLSILDQFYKELNEDQYKPSPLIEEVVGSGKLGRKVMRGFYEYE